MNFWEIREKFFLFVRERPFLVLGVLIIVLGAGGYYLRRPIWGLFRTQTISVKTPEVNLPTIVNGELVLPKVMLGLGGDLNKESQLHVISANLFGVFESTSTTGNTQVSAGNTQVSAGNTQVSAGNTQVSAGNTQVSAGNTQVSAGNSMQPKLVGIRIMGEVQNVGKTVITELSPVVRFLDANNLEIAKKLGRVTPGFDFFGVLPNSRTLYDVIVDDPPQADKMEVVLNAVPAHSPSSGQAKFDLLKVLNGAIDVKKAVNQKQSADSRQQTAKGELASESGEASSSGKETSASGGPTESEPFDSFGKAQDKSAQGEGEITEVPQEIEYYTVSGSVVNSLSDPVSDVTVYVWVKDAQGHVFSFGRQDFKGDLISPKKTVDFKINLFPFKDGEKYDKYEVGAWGSRYTL